MRVEEVNLPDYSTGYPSDTICHQANNVKYEADIRWTNTGEHIHVVWENPTYDRGDFGRNGVWEILTAVRKMEERPRTGIETNYLKLKMDTKPKVSGTMKEKKE